MMLRRALLALAFFACAVPADAATVNLGSPYRDTGTGAIYLRGAPSPYVLSLPALCATNQFSTGGSTSTGLPVCAQPSFSNLTGQASAAQIAAGAAASNVGTLGGALAGSTLPNPTIANAYVTGAMLASGAAATNLGAAIGTSGASIGLLNGNNTYSGNMTFSGTNSHSGAESFTGSVTVPTVATATSGTSAASAGLVDAKIGAAVAASVPNIFSFTNLKVLPGGTPASQATVSADRIILQGPSTGLMRAAVSVTCSTGTTGANGLDTGTLAASTWYAVYVIDNGTAPACLLSTSATAPTLPSGYTYSARVGWQRTNGTPALIGISQYNRTAQYVVDGTRLSGLPLIATNSGGPATPTWVSTSVATSVPPSAAAIDIILNSTSTSNFQGAVAPNANYGANGSSSNPPPLLMSGPTATGAGSRGMIRFETAGTVFVAIQSGATAHTVGWEDNL